MKTFSTFEQVEGVSPCLKKQIVVHAKQIHEPFQVETKEGIFQGVPGDYLMKGIEGELYVCERSIFEKSYDFLAELNDYPPEEWALNGQV